MEAPLTAQPTAQPKLSRDDLLAPFHGALTPPDLWLVGTEAEKFGLLADSHAPLPYEGERSVTAVLEALENLYGWFPEHEYEGGALIALRRGEASITLEPGGQLELSGSPFASIHHTQLEWSTHLMELHDIGERLGIVWLGLGFHPFARQADLPWVPKLRYGIMREYLPTRGTMGLDMMRRTCTVQANLDYASEADAMQKLRISLALSPIITAMFANSPLVEGKLTGERTHRALVWLNTDPDRSGLLPFAFRDDASFESYVEWALDVPMFMVKRGNKALHNTGQTFRQFMRDGFEGAEARLDDWVTHLGTLFPEVRLKKTLEIRGADSTPGDLVSALPALAKGLLYDATARGKAEALASRIDYAAAEAARPDISVRGLKAELAGRPLGEWASEVLAIAQEGLANLAAIDPVTKNDERVHLVKLAQLVHQQKTPADALIEQLDLTRPLEPQIVELAKL
jgi:glutamate--cysteine ligase